MRKLIAAINMTLDGYCDHTAMIADDALHDHYTELLRNAGVILYGRITFQLMEYWPPLVKKPTGNRSTDDFAVAIDEIPKIVFSRTIKSIDWESAKLAERELHEEVSELKQQAGKDIMVGSRSLIVQLLNLALVDEFQITVHPVIAGKGLPLLENINERIQLRFLDTKTFSSSGSVTLYYEPIKR